MTKKKEKVEIDLDIDQSKFDDCNALVITDSKSAKKNTKPEKKTKSKQVILSKKKRKKYQKILERKNKKLNRNKLITDLQEYQVKDAEYDLMPSTSVLQTAGRKRINDIIKLYNSINKQENVEEDFTYKRPKIPKIRLKNNEKNFNRKDLNIVGSDIGDESSSDDDEEEEDLSDEDTEDNQISQTGNEESFISNNEIESEEIKQAQEKECLLNSNLTSDNEKNKKQSSVDETETKSINNKTPGEQQKKPIKKSVYVTVNREENVQEARLKLPILAEEHSIMEEIMYNPVVIICGETGSGKTTQVPQFLYEAGYTMNGKMIGITEPRRVAAISMSKRVAYELNTSAEEVSYQVRFEGNVTDKTKIKFMTDGILMKEIQQDFLLRKYSAIIIDEAHERSLYSDILIGFLSRVVQTRLKQGDPLKLIIMSATLRVEDFTANTRLFKTSPPVIKVDSRQFPVSVHFNKNTNPNYVKEAFKKICKIHSSLPPGGILVFVTGRKEVLSLCKMLKEKFPFENAQQMETKKEIDKFENNESCNDDNEQNPKVEKDALPTVNLDLYSVNPIENEQTLDDRDYSDDESNSEDVDSEHEDFIDDISVTTKEPLYCLPLYSMLPNYKQSLVFKDPPPDCRLCVIATNVAETSLTIPNIKYVIDSGKVKNKVYDNVTGVSTFVVEWTSKASADQRSGRAGRTSPGHCYRLYSSAVYNDQFKKYADPEIIIKPIDDLLLQMKAIGIDNVVNFPFPTQPKVDSLIAAEKRLIMLDALSEHKYYGKKNKTITRSKVTHIGRIMSCFPVNPRYSKMLCLSNQNSLMPYTIAIISGLTVQELFLFDEDETTKKSRKHVFFTNPNCLILGDLMTILSAIGAANFEGLSNKFCEHYGLRHNAMVEVNKLRSQLSNQIKQITKTVNVSLDISVPTDSQVKLLRQLFLCGFVDHVAKRIPVTYVTEEDSSGNVIKKEKSIRNCYQSIEVENNVFISPQSALHNETPEYVVYHELFESTKMYMRNIVVIEPEWLPIFAPKQCNFSNPLDSPPPRFDPKEDKVKCYRTSTFGPYNWKLPAVEVEYPDGNDKYRYFAYFLFNGNVLKWFAKNLKFISTPPIIFIKTWAFVQPKVEKVVKCLINNEIVTKKALMNKWKTDNQFLLNEYVEWIQESQRDKIQSSWPPNS